MAIEEVDARKLFNIILESKDLDFVCFAITPWHAIGVDAFVLDLSQQLRRRPKGIIVQIGHRRQGFIINEKNFVSNRFADARFVKIQDKDFDLSVFLERKWVLAKFVLSLFRYLLWRLVFKVSGKKRKTLHFAYMVNPNIFSIVIFRSRDLSSRYVPVYHILDEGLRSYLNPLWGWLMVRNLEQGNRPYRLSGEIERFLKDFLFGPLYYLFLSCLISRKKGSLFTSTSRLRAGKPDRKRVQLYREVLAMRTENLRRIAIPDYKRGIVILCTQPLSEAGIISKEQEKSILSQLLELIIEKMELSLIVKRHPREDVKKYRELIENVDRSSKITFAEEPMSLEDFLSRLDESSRPCAVIGYSSMALITSKVIFNTPALSYFRITSEYSNRNFWARFSQPLPFDYLTRNLISFPRDLNEFECCLEKYCRK